MKSKPSLKGTNPDASGLLAYSEPFMVRFVT